MTPDFAGLLAADGLTGWLHAVDLDTGAEVGHLPDELVVPASVFKVPVLVELCRRYDDGSLDPCQRVRLRTGEQETRGGTGYSVTLDDVEVSLRDLALSMMSVSDNRATDVVIDLLGGVGPVNATSARLGFARTVLAGDCTFLWAHLDQATTPALTTRTTPRETTGLLAGLWRDELLTAAGSAEARRILGLQVWPHRLGSGFPEADVRIAAKTGTLLHLRSEAGVVEYPDGGRYAVAVFVSGRSDAPRNPVADAAIGRLGRAAVDALRG